MTNIKQLQDRIEDLRDAFEAIKDRAQQNGDDGYLSMAQGALDEDNKVSGRKN